MGVGEVIKGWDRGIGTMRKGEISKLTIQPEFAYGEAGQPPKIPPNAVLIFEIELINVVEKNDVFRDGKATKTITEEGKGFESPNKDEEVKFTMKIIGADDEALLEYIDALYIISSNQIKPDNFKNEVVATLVDKVLSGMHLEEKCEVKCVKDYLFPGKGETTMHLQLQEVHKSSDVSIQKDGTVIKKQINNIEEYGTPQDDNEVTLRIHAITDGDGEPIAGFSGPRDISFTAGSGETCDALESAAPEMKKGEVAEVTCTVPSKCIDVDLGLTDVKAVPAKVIFKLEMVEFKKSSKELWSLSGEEKYLISMARKEMGGSLFKAKRFELALNKYRKVTEMLNNTDKMSQDCKQRAAELKHVAEMNKAACYLQLGDPTSALSICNTIIQADRNNVKALLRRAKAHFSRGEHVEAEKDLERVLELEPETAEAKTLLPQVKRAQKVADKASGSTFAKMCQGLGKVGFGKENKKPEPKPKTEEPKDEPNPDTVIVAFKIDKKVEPGEHVYVVGEAEALGEWNIDKGSKMKRIPGPPDYEAMALGKPPKETNLWEVSVEMPVALGRTEYRYAVRRPTGDELEEGEKHAMQLGGMGGSRMRCKDEWRQRSYGPIED
jgi:Tfp pilus assembly protein PilF/FKBP-type peptidyl-prolyl cis-trans isomerase 2